MTTLATHPAPPAPRPRAADPAPVVRAIGVDPGRTTALVALDVPIGVSRIGPPRFDVESARWVDHRVVRPSTSARLTEAEQAATLFDRACEALRAFGPADAIALVVLERPADAAAAWENAGRRDGRPQQRGTEFGLGERYGAVLAAVRLVAPQARLACYPVNNLGQQPGWMQAGERRPQRRDAVLERLRVIARRFGGPAELSEDSLCALGVVLFHLVSTDPTAAMLAAAEARA